MMPQLRNLWIFPSKHPEIKVDWRIEIAFSRVAAVALNGNKNFEDKIILPKFYLCLIKIPSKKRLYVSIDSFATLGRNSNIFKKFEWYASAGSTSILGKKPCVRGVAMNPVDHPHGGRTKTNKPEVSPWGWVTKHSH